jgi:hypothetical protein
LSAKGLVVVGVSNEGMGLIDGHLEKAGMRYPVANVESAIGRMYGAKSFPSAWLVDATGRVVWKGNPYELYQEQVEELLVHAAFVPVLEGKEYKSLNKLVANRDFGKAHAMAVKAIARGKEEPGYARLRDSIEELVRREMEKASGAIENQDHGQAWSIYGEVAECFAGMPVGDDAKAKRGQLEKQPDAKSEIKAYKKLIKADATQAGGDFEKAAKAYRSIAKRYPDTESGRQARDYLERHGF